MPRRINQVLNRLLLLGAVEQRTRIDGAMVHQVLAELADDGTLSLARPAPARPESRPEPEPEVEATVPEPQVEPAPAPVEQIEAVAVARIEAALADRDAQISELQQAVIELANATENVPDQANSAIEAIAALNGRIADLESRLIEQDRTIRHTLTMLIEWIESDDMQRAAA